MKALEQTHLFSEGLMMRQVEDDNGRSVIHMLDLDDEQGAEVCKTYLCSIERLMSSLGLAL